MTPVVIVGASDQGHVAHEVLRAQGNCEIIGFLDDDVSVQGTAIHGVPVLGPLQWAVESHRRNLGFIVAIGDNDVRVALGSRLRTRGLRAVNAVHPSAVIMPRTSLGTGNLVCAGAILVTGARLEDDVVINTAATVDHDSIVQTGAQIAPGVHTGGRVTVGRGAFIGMGAVLAPGVMIGDRCIVGAGSVVLSDLPPDVLAFGTPAKVVKPLEDPVDWHTILCGKCVG
jgi:sugar O-acyltransferase (sialic acid O-acetyltransferase NeuD family)